MHSHAQSTLLKLALCFTPLHQSHGFVLPHCMQIIPYEKSEVIQMLYKLLYIESQLEGTP